MRAGDSAFFLKGNSLDLSEPFIFHEHHDLWRLAPAYDLNPFPARQGHDLKTWISENTGPQASIENLCTAARAFGLKMPRVREVLRAVDSAVGGWASMGAKLGINRRELDQFFSAFEHKERAVVKQLVG